jgi:hypothetical protein
VQKYHRKGFEGRRVVKVTRSISKKIKIKKKIKKNNKKKTNLVEKNSIKLSARDCWGDLDPSKVQRQIVGEDSRTPGLSSAYETVQNDF